jgi:uncharacterized protein (DUF2249 family)
MTDQSPELDFIDVRTIAHGLKVGEAFVIVNDHDPRPLHYQLSAEYPGQFSWTYLEAGPDVWRVALGREVAA